MDLDQDTGFTLGELQVSPSHNTLTAKGRSLKLQPKAMAVLHYLALNHQRVISNEELIERLWAGRVVTHGSVQKSINTLRGALSELLGEQEMIAHYSKRGYQLTLEPVFAAATQTIEEPAAFLMPAGQIITSPVSSSTPTPKLRSWLLIAAVVAVIGIVIDLVFVPHRLSVPKHHKTQFTTTQGYTNETGHERSATPHPDNQHVAYIRERFNVTHKGETESDIVIRNAAGKDWRVATSEGSWFKLAWSPAGKNLVAVEVKRRDGMAMSTDFFEKPNYLYSFHIFGLDLAKERLLEKQQLSQWQGRILSVSWWDENTLEIVAKQGPSSGNGRYRYAIHDQQLKLLDEMEGAANPVASATLNQRTALASLHKNALQIDFLDAEQKRISHVQLDVPAADISWIPDGSGVLVYAEEERKLLAVYLDGQQVQIPVADAKDKILSRPRYAADGNGIYFTEEKRSSNILLLGLDGQKTQLTKNADLNYAASFSPDGTRVVYASVRNNQIHLWLVEGGRERQLTSQPIPKRVGAIVWSPKGDELAFSAGNQIYRHKLATGTTELLVNGPERIESLAYSPATNQLLLVKSNGEARNLWRVDTKTHQQKQLTFGAVGSAVEFEGDVIFQYVGEPGLWALRAKGDKLEPIAAKLGEYSKLLKADATGVYFIRGGLCHESDIYYWNYAKGAQSTFMTRDDNIVATTSFLPSRGVLHTECYLPEANIILMK